MSLMRGRILRSLEQINRLRIKAGIGGGPLTYQLKKRIRPFLERWLMPEGRIQVKIRGQRLWIYPHTAETEAYLLLPYEPYTLELFEKSIPPGGTVLDIGAQFGLFSLLAAQRTGPQGRVFAFEPAPHNLELLRRNVEENLRPNITIVPKAVGNRRGTVRLFLYEGSDSHSLYQDSRMPTRGTAQVECITIDEFLGDQPTDVIKMDIEGHELHALEGMEETLRRNPGLILFAEFVPSCLRRAGVDPQAYLERLHRLGLNFRKIHEEKCRLQPLIPGEWEKDPRWRTNLYCTSTHSP